MEKNINEIKVENSPEVKDNFNDSSHEVQKELARKAVEEQVRESSDTLETLKPETSEQAETKSILEKVRGLFRKREKTQEEYESIGRDAIKAHPAKSMMLEDLQSTNPDLALKYILAVGKNPNVKYWKWDEKKEDFVDSTKYTVASGEGTAGA